MLQLHTNVLTINRDLVWQSSDTLTHVRSSESAATSSFLFLALVGWDSQTYMIHYSISLASC